MADLDRALERAHDFRELLEADISVNCYLVSSNCTMFRPFWEK